MAAELTDEQIDVELSRACVKAWDASSYTSGKCDAVHPMYAAAFEAGARAILALSATGAEDAELRKKAARYDFLRSMVYDDRIIVSPDRMLSGDALDTAIDAARSQSNGG